jgi:hypothetical protein
MRQPPNIVRKIMGKMHGLSGHNGWLLDHCLDDNGAEFWIIVDECDVVFHC